MWMWNFLTKDRGKMENEIHPLTNNPSEAWEQISKKQKVFQIKVNIPTSDVASDKVRFVCMSDTHSLTNELQFTIPNGDVFIHAGDFTRCGDLEEVIQFNNWIGQLPHKYKIVIAGNHELSFDQNIAQTANSDNEFNYSYLSSRLRVPQTELYGAVNAKNIRECLTNCIYLEDSEITLYGIKIYGTPWQPEYGKLAFNLPRGEECLNKWKKIPLDTTILITHTPPIGHGDHCFTGVRAGCVELLNIVQQKIKPKYHVFGHIHEGYGITTDGKIIYINASTCNILYQAVNLPIVFDCKIPQGFSKTET